MNLQSINRPGQQAARAQHHGLVSIMMMISAVVFTGCASLPTANESAAGAAGTDRFARSNPVDIQDPFELARVADTAYDAGRLLEAQRFYRALTVRVPDDAYAWFRLGNIALRQGDVAAAEQAFSKSLQRDDKNPKAWYNLATARLMHAQLALRSAYEQLRPEDPARSLTQNRLAALDNLIANRLEETASPAANPAGFFIPVPGGQPVSARRASGE
jgi:tetratricopeptide (TPR) repeat protein